MNEMLANQYFIAERFQDACEQFEEVLNEMPNNCIAMKRLILCYIFSRKLKTAFELFVKLLHLDINVISEHEINVYNQLCPKLISELESSESEISETEKGFLLGMLWMYCDVKKAKKYFSGLSGLFQNDNELKEIVTIINNYLHNK